MGVSLGAGLLVDDGAATDGTGDWAPSLGCCGLAAVSGGGGCWAPTVENAVSWTSVRTVKWPCCASCAGVTLP